MTLKTKAKKWQAFFETVTIHQILSVSARTSISAILRDAIISARSDVHDAQFNIPLMEMNHPTNALGKHIMTRNFYLLWGDPYTKDIYQPVRVLCAYRRENNLHDSLVRSLLNDATASVEDRSTFPCGQSRCNTCDHTNASPAINSPGGYITINSKYTCTSFNVVYLIKYHNYNEVYIGETGRRL